MHYDPTTSEVSWGVEAPSAPLFTTVTQTYPTTGISSLEMSIDAPEGYKIIAYNGPIPSGTTTNALTYSVVEPIVLTDTKLTMSIVRNGGSDALILTLFCIKV